MSGHNVVALLPHLQGRTAEAFEAALARQDALPGLREVFMAALTTYQRDHCAGRGIGVSIGLKQDHRETVWGFDDPSASSQVRFERGFIQSSPMTVSLSALLLDRDPEDVETAAQASAFYASHCEWLSATVKSSAVSHAHALMTILLMELMARVSVVYTVTRTTERSYVAMLGEVGTEELVVLTFTAPHPVISEGAL
jgi:hypothetical protein